MRIGAGWEPPIILRPSELGFYMSGIWNTDASLCGPLLFGVHGVFEAYRIIPPDLQEGSDIYGALSACGACAEGRGAVETVGKLLMDLGASPGPTSRTLLCASAVHGKRFSSPQCILLNAGPPCEGPGSN